MTSEAQAQSEKLDTISKTLAIMARRQETLSRVLELLVVHIPDTTPPAAANDQACMCQITFSNLEVED